jgi:hypothetical protein
MNWWLWLALAVLAGGGAVFFAALGVSAGTAYGSHYHSLSRRQKWMGATLYRGSLVAAVGSGAVAVLAVALAVRQFLA